MAGRVVIVGFDALDARYLDAFEERLPHFSRFRQNGVEAPLESTFPPWTGSAWSSLYTGCSPDYHGVFDFFDYTDAYPDEAPVVTRDNVQAPAIWNYCTARDLSSIVLNVPVTHPADQIDGVLVPGYLAPESASGHPAGIRDELNDVLECDYRIYADNEMAANDEEKLEEYASLVRSRGKAASYLLEEHEWEFAFIQVQKTDTVFHNFDDGEAFRRVYTAADEVLGQILDLVDEEDTVLVCSDHGMGLTDGYTVYLNEILRDRGFVTTSGDSAGVALGDRKYELMETNSGSQSLHANLVELVVGLSKSIGLSPATVYSVADRVGLGDHLKSILPGDVKESMSDGADWSASRAYCRSAAELGVRINQRGREPAGVVDGDEYETIREELIEILKSLETPDRTPVFESVRRREEVYDGPYTDRACDVLVVPAEMNHSLSTRMYGTEFASVTHYDHKRTGVFIGQGPGIEAATGSLSVVDLAPLAMAALELPIPSRMTGSIPECFNDESVQHEEYDMCYDGELEPATADDDVTDRLEDLGYI